MQPNVRLYRRCERLPMPEGRRYNSVRLYARGTSTSQCATMGDKRTWHSCTRRYRTSWSAVQVLVRCAIMGVAQHLQVIARDDKWRRGLHCRCRNERSNAPSSTRAHLATSWQDTVLSRRFGYISAGYRDPQCFGYISAGYRDPQCSDNEERCLVRTCRRRAS